MARTKDSRYMRIARHMRARKKVSGTSERPRLAVFRSLKHIYAQIVDDAQGRTLTHASSLDGEVKAQKAGKNKKDVSGLVGVLIAQRAKEKGISKVVLDRGGSKYHGRVRFLAEAARGGGLEF